MRAGSRSLEAEWRDVEGGRRRPAGTQRTALIWSKTPPSSKWVFCALRQPPKTSSMVTSFTGAKVLAYFAAILGSRGR